MPSPFYMFGSQAPGIPFVGGSQVSPFVARAVVSGQAPLISSPQYHPMDLSGPGLWQQAQQHAAQQKAAQAGLPIPNAAPGGANAPGAVSPSWGAATTSPVDPTTVNDAAAASAQAAADTASLAGVGDAAAGGEAAAAAADPMSMFASAMAGLGNGAAAAGSSAAAGAGDMLASLGSSLASLFAFL